MKTGKIEQSVFFEASPQQVYQLLMDADLYGAFSDSEVKMDAQPGGKFEVFDGYCHGINLELEEGKKIIQKWHFEEDGWPDDHFSDCSFLFYPEKNGTRMDFTQTGIPIHKVDALADGWRKYYWQPMAEMIKK